MPLISFTAFLIPRSTSQLLVAPKYEKPLLQVKYNTGVGDREKWVKTLPEIPKALPLAAHARELQCEPEMERLAATYGAIMFRQVYVTDEAFELAFKACQIATLPGQEGAVPEMAAAPEALIEEFLELNIPSMNKAKATKLVEAGFQVLTMPKAEPRSVEAVTGLSLNLIRSTIEAAGRIKIAPGPRRAPSAPSEMRATVEAPV